MAPASGALAPDPPVSHTQQTQAAHVREVGAPLTLSSPGTCAHPTLLSPSTRPICSPPPPPGKPELDAAAVQLKTGFHRESQALTCVFLSLLDGTTFL